MCIFGFDTVTYQLPVTYRISGVEVTFEDHACTLKPSRCFLNLYPLPADIVSSLKDQQLFLVQHLS